MKKWIIFVFTVVFVGIGVLIYKGSTMDIEDYLEAAETFHERENYKQEMFNLGKALEISLEVNGATSLETADIYRKIGALTWDLDEAVEYFDRAIFIYEMENGNNLADVYFEKGQKLRSESAGVSAAADMARENIEKAVELYERDGYENPDRLCLSYVYLASWETDGEKQWDYLKKAESHVPGLSQENEWSIGNAVYRLMGTMGLVKGMLEESLASFDILLNRVENSREEDAQQIAAEAWCLSGISLVSMGRAEEGKERMEKAAAFYDRDTKNVFYADAAMVHGYLAEAYSSMEPPMQQQVLDEGKRALSYYTQRDTITSEDSQAMDLLKDVLKSAYVNAFPEKGDSGFEAWYEENSRLTAKNYYFY